MRRALLALCGAALGALLGLPVAIWIWAINPGRGPVSLPVLSGDVWLTLFVCLAVPVVVVQLISGLLHWETTLRTSFIAAATLLFFLLWLVRIESAHQPLSVAPHLSTGGALALLLIASASVLLWTLAMRRRTMSCLIALIVVSAGLELLARAQTPERRRDDAVREIGAYVHPAGTPTPVSRRVLVIGVDGMDWRVVSTLVRAGKMPAVERLLHAGRYFQMDNLGMHESPEIWTSIYTGMRGPQSGISGFQFWYFRGVAGRINSMPRFGVHTILFLDRLLGLLKPFHLWSSVLATNEDIVTTPLWTCLSAAGLRVAVFDPLPLQAVPERVNGVFVVPRGADEHYDAYTERGLTHYPARFTDETTPKGMIQDELVRRRVAAEILRSERFDTAIYYANFLDGTQHLAWMTVCDGCASRADFASSIIGRGYIEADHTIEALMAAFGAPATVVLVSDHGWDYGDYEHFASPMGMFVISPSRSSGYGGFVRAPDLARIIASLAGLSPEQQRTKPRRDFIAERPEEEERRRVLRSLGYIGN